MRNKLLESKNIIFLLVIILAIFFRFHNLLTVPPSGSLDEVSIGYNAYSILKTGADEYGTKLPLLLRAYDDWRPALYVYLVVPFIKIFGINILSVRLPSVLLSVATVIATYFLVKQIFGNKNLALLSSLLLSINPWHIYISRLGHEVNAGLSFSVFAVLFFLKSINSKRGLFLILSSIFFGLSLYTYQSEKIFIPLIILILVFVYKKDLFKLKKTLLLSIILGFVITIPIVFVTLSPQGLIRFKGTSAFTQEYFYKKSAEEILKSKNQGNLLGELVNNRRLVPLKIFTTNYFSHFNPNFLFSNSGNESFKAPNFGLMYFWELPFLLIGLFYLFTMKERRIKFLVILWLLVAFIAPSLTTGAPHAMRSFSILPIPQVLISLGLFKIIRSKIAGLIVVIISVFFLSNFYKEYFFSFPKNQSSSFQYPLHNAVKFVSNKEKNYKKIVFSNKGNLYQSYMFYLFGVKYDPYLYQKQGGTKSGGFDEEHKFDKYEFRPIIWDKDKYAINTLFIGNISDFPYPKKILMEFFSLDQKETVEVVETQ